MILIDKVGALFCACGCSYGYDPFGLSKKPENFSKYQAYELIHARWAMLGAAGFIIPEAFNKFGASCGPEAVWFKVPTSTLHTNYIFCDLMGMAPPQLRRACPVSDSWQVYTIHGIRAGFQFVNRGNPIRPKWHSGREFLVGSGMFGFGLSCIQIVLGLGCANTRLPDLPTYLQWMMHLVLGISFLFFIWSSDEYWSHCGNLLKWWGVEISVDRSTSPRWEYVELFWKEHPHQSGLRGYSWSDSCWGCWVLQNYQWLGTNFSLKLLSFCY